MNFFLSTLKNSRRVRRCGLFCVLLAAQGLVLGVAWAESGGVLFQCPRNLFTNQMDAAQARLQGCSRVAPGRITQGVAQAEPVAVAPVASVSLPPIEEATPSLVAAPTAGVPVAPVAPISPAASVRPPAPVALRVANTQQRARDQDAQTILRTELARTQAAQQALQRSGDPTQTAALGRLREDEAALRRELARFNP